MPNQRIRGNQITDQRTIIQNEHEEQADAKRVLIVDENGNPQNASSSIQILDKPYDAGTQTYPTSTQEVVTTFLGGLLGTPVQRVTLNYSDATKENLLNWQREFWNGSGWLIG